MTNEKIVDFADLKTAFAHKTDAELKKTAWLFSMMNNAWLVEIGSKFGAFAVKNKLPFAEMAVKETIFGQFVGGTTLLECMPIIENLSDHNVACILDYGVEAKQKESDFDITMNECIRAIHFAGQTESVSVVCTKISGLARFGMLEDLQSGKAPLTVDVRSEYRRVLKRLDAICHVASQKGVIVFFDAEESWIQDTIDHLVVMMMQRYNQKRVVVYNTYQMYRTDMLKQLMNDHSHAVEKGYLLGAKLVRGAYMEKERERAEDRGYPSPIHLSKQATDHSYNTGIRYCMQHYRDIAICNASHNAISCQLMAQLIADSQAKRDHIHFNFSQLYGMSDHLSFNLAAEGYNVAKYMPYGPVREVIPYLMRRAQENSSIAGDMSREHMLVKQELERRKG